MKSDYKEETHSVSNKKVALNINFYDPHILWINDFLTQFSENYQSDPTISYEIYKKYEDQILQHQFQQLPPEAYSEHFLNILFDMLDPKFEDNLFCVSLNILEIFYFNDSSFDWTSLVSFIHKIHELLVDMPDQIVDSVFRFLARIIKSHELYKFIYDLFPIEFLDSILDREDLIESISLLINSYSKYKNEIEEYGKMLDLCVRIFQSSIVKDREGEYKVLERITFQRSFDSILSICMNVSDNYKNMAVEFLYDKEIDCLFNDILFSFHDCIQINLLQLIHFMFKNVKLIPTNQSFEAILNDCSPPLKLPRIDYTCFITIVNQYEEYLDNYDILILSLKTLYCEISLNHYDERFFQYMYEKKLIRVIHILINDSPHNLKINTVSFISKLLPYMPIYILDELLELEIPSTLIDYLDIGEHSITSTSLKCLASFVKSMNKYGMPIDLIAETYQTHRDEFEIPESAKDDLVNLEIALSLNNK